MDDDELGQSPLWSTPLDDIEELQEEATAVGWDIRYTQQGAGRLDGTLKELRLPSLLVAHEVYGRGFFFTASLPEDFTPALFPLRSRDGLRVNGRPYDRGDIVMPAELSELSCGGPNGVDLITLHLEPESLSDLSALLGEGEFDHLLRLAMLRHRGDPQQLTAFEGLLDALLQEDAWSSPADANRLEAIRCKVLEDFAALLQDAGPVESASRDPRRSVWMQYARQARDFLDDNLDRAVSLAELCRITGTSARTLQYAFRDQYGVAPQVYHRARRLNAVHRSLKKQWANGTTVTDVALDHGFWHLGRFSQAYKLRFGELPSETLARRPVRPRPASPFSYTATLTPMRRALAPRWNRSGKVLLSKKRGADLSGLSGAASRRRVGSRGTAD